MSNLADALLYVTDILNLRKERDTALRLYKDHTGYERETSPAANYPNCPTLRRAYDHPNDYIQDRVARDTHIHHAWELWRAHDRVKRDYNEALEELAKAVPRGIWFRVGNIGVIIDRHNERYILNDKAWEQVVGHE